MIVYKPVFVLSHFSNKGWLCIHTCNRLIPKTLIGMQGQDSYLFMFSNVLEGKAIMIAFLQPAEILVTSKEF